MSDGNKLHRSDAATGKVFESPYRRSCFEPAIMIVSWHQNVLGAYENGYRVVKCFMEISSILL